MAFARGAVDVIDGAFPLRVWRQHLLVVKIHLRYHHLSFEKGIEESHQHVGVFRSTEEVLESEIRAEIHEYGIVRFHSLTFIPLIYKIIAISAK